MTDPRRFLLRPLVTVIVTALLLLPLVLATISLRARPYTPLHDSAMIEQSVRDVGTIHTPLLGVPGRMKTPDGAARHPGPLAYYLLTPTYYLFGATAWALQVATAALNGLAIVVSMLLARLRVGASSALGVAIATAILMQGYGLSLLTEPWNPYYSVLWFALFLFTVWAVWCGDVAVLPVAAGAATFCAQSHVAYMALCGPLGVSAAIAVGHQIWRQRADPEARRRGTYGLLLTVLVLVLLWSPPVLEEFTSRDGNLSKLFAYFLSPREAPLGVSAALQLVLERLDIWHLVVHQFIEPGGLIRYLEAPVPNSALGAAFGVTWLFCAALSTWLRNRQLLVLNGVLLLSLGVAVVAVSRIVEGAYPYLLLWGWVLGAMLLLSCTWTAALLAGRAVPRRLAQRWETLGVALLCSAVAFLALRLCPAAYQASPGAPQAVARLAAVAPVTLDAIEDSVGAATGYQGRYRVTWTDAYYGAALAIGLANELERAGVEVGMAPFLAQDVGEHRTLSKREATARIHLASGVWISRWRTNPKAVEVAFVDPRTAEERAEYDSLRAGIIEALEKEGRTDLAGRFDEDIGQPLPLHLFFGLAAGRLLEIGGPVAVFIAPP